MKSWLLVMLSLAVPGGLFAVEQSATAADAGDVAFANSGAPGAQADFLRGLALLHDFEYPTAAESFRLAQAADPGFAMAYWGEAMTYTHPVWFQQDLPAARAALARLGATPTERAAKAPTERERAYLHAVEVLYGEGSKEARDVLFADAMAAVHDRYPDDVDATAFTALALLGTAHQGRDFTIYMRAAALLEAVFPTHPRHPGVLHYLIHCYDDPVHAPLGQRAARLYGEVAPGAGHALHMTSHIFLSLGLWPDVIRANEQAIAVVNAQRAARSKPRGDCGHYPTWLHYGLLQVGRFDDARAALAACRTSAFAEPFVSAGPMDARTDRLEEYAIMRAQQVASGDALPPAGQALAADAELVAARFTLAYADTLAAGAAGDAAHLEQAVAQLRLLERDVLAAIAADQEANPSRQIRAEVIGLQAEALTLATAGARPAAITLLEKAAAREEAMPIEFGPPYVEKPSRELLGDQLLAAGRAAEAVAAYQRALARAPGRAVSLAGLRRAEAALTATSPRVAAATKP
jgi:tetratricopeptide (TPR) repeat protein